MHRLTAALLFLTASLPAAAKEERYRLDASHTAPAFAVSHLGFSTQRGVFDDSEGELRLDLDAKTGSVTVSIAAASVDTGHAERDENLRGEEWLAVKRYPTLRFESERFLFEGERLARVDGRLTLRGLTRPISLQVVHFHCGKHPMLMKRHCGAELAGSLKRSDYGMSAYFPAVGDEVRLSIQVEASHRLERRPHK